MTKGTIIVGTLLAGMLLGGVTGRALIYGIAYVEKTCPVMYEQINEDYRGE